MKKYAAICSKRFRNWKKTVIKKSRRIKYKIITAKGREWKILFVEKKEGSVYIKDKVVNVEKYLFSRYFNTNSYQNDF